MRRMENERLAQWIVALAAALVYLNSLGNGFVFDDRVAIVENPLVTQPRLLLLPFATDYWHGTSIDLLYRPLTVFTYGVERLVHGMRPMYFHLVNLVLHVLMSVVVFRTTQLLFGRLRLASITAMLFALHPIHTEAVTSIVGRAEMLMSLFSLLAMQYYLKARSAPQPLARHLFVSCMLCYLLACFSKENGITVPALLLLAEVTLCLHTGNWDRFKRENLRRAVLCYTTFAGMGVMYLLIRFMVLGHLATANQNFTVRGSLIGFPWHLQFANALQYFAQYLRLLFFPVRLSSDYSYNQFPAHATIWHWDIGIGALLLVLVIAVMLFSVRRAPPVFFGLAFFMLTFLPVSNFIIPIIALLAERALYLPSFGMLLAVAWVFDAVLQKLEVFSERRPARAFVYAILAVIAILFAVRTVVRNRDWKDEITLFSSAVRVCPDCGNCYSCLGDALAEAGRFQEADAAYNRSLEIIPDHGVFWFRKANALLKSNKIDEAIEAYKNAVHFEPQLSDACDQLGRLYIGMGRLDEALFWALKAVAIQPGKALFHYNLGYILQRQHKPGEALRQYREAAALNPDEPSYAFNLGLVQRDLGDLDNALANFQKAAELDPKNEKYWMTYADAALKRGSLQAAAQALDEFIKVSTNVALVAKAKEILGQIRK